MWCVAHRSALAMDSFVVTVPELKMWLANIKSIGTYFRVSAKRKKLLYSLTEDPREFIL